MLLEVYQNMSKFRDRRMALGRVPLIEYAQLKQTLADCELIFKMADDKRVKT